METKKLYFMIKHFGCYTKLDGNKVLTSLANASRVPVVELWNVFSGDAEEIFDIIPTGDKNELSLILDETTRRSTERICCEI